MLRCLLNTYAKSNWSLMSHICCSFENKLEDFNMKKTVKPRLVYFYVMLQFHEFLFNNFWRAKSNLKLYPLLRTCMMLMVDIHYFRFRQNPSNNENYLLPNKTGKNLAHNAQPFQQIFSHSVSDSDITIWLLQFSRQITMLHYGHCQIRTLHCRKFSVSFLVMVCN